MSDIISYIDEHGTDFEEELFELLRIPSISTSSEHKSDVQEAADFLVKQLESLDLDRVEKIETDGHPVVYAEYMPHLDQPTVLVYGHYDVQPPDPLEEWETPPFEPTVRDGKIYARGAADDKGQVFTHVKALEAYRKSGEDFPVNIKFVIEGEEEIGSPHLAPFLEEHRDQLEADMVLVSDTAMFAEDTPSITYGLRGMIYMEVELVGPNRDLHSGVYGGAVDNPANVLCEIIAQLKDDDGRIQIPGFYDNVKDLTPEERDAYQQLPFDEEAFKDELQVRALNGEKGYTTLERSSARPTLDVNGMWSGYQGEGAKTVLPAKAGAKVSMRLVPDQDPHEIGDLFRDHIRTITPDTVSVDITEHHGGYPAMTDPDFYGIKAAAEAFESVYEKEPLLKREGGTIPIIADFKRILDAESILMGFSLDSSAIHSPNENFLLKDFHRGIKTSAKFFEVLSKHAE